MLLLTWKDKLVLQHNSKAKLLWWEKKSSNSQLQLMQATIDSLEILSTENQVKL